MNSEATNPSHEVTVIGLGAMGSALARAFADAGRRVMVWNRSPDRTRAAAAVGADVADSVAEAVAASPLVVFCLWDYTAADEILGQEGVSGALRGKVVAQLSTGSSEEASAFAARLRACGATFLAGGIMCYPRAVGDQDTVILYSGDRHAFLAYQDVLETLAPSQRFVGEDPGDVAVVYTAVWGFYFTAMAGLFDGLALVDTAGISRDHVEGMLEPMSRKFVEGARDVIERLDAGNFSGDQSTIQAHVDGIRATCEDIRTRGVEPRMLDAFVAQLEVAAAKGRGGHDVAAVVEALAMPAATARDGM